MLKHAFSSTVRQFAMLVFGIWKTEECFSCINLLSHLIRKRCVWTYLLVDIHTLGEPKHTLYVKKPAGMQGSENP